MKKISFLYFALAAVLFAENYNINSGWNLLGSVNNLTSEHFNNSSINIVWTYNKSSDETEASWKFYTPNEDIKKLALAKNLTQINEFEKGSGFWLYSLSNNLELGLQEDQKDDNTNSEIDNTTTTEYLAKVVYLDDDTGLLSPIANAIIYDDEENKIGTTNSYGKFYIEENGKYSILSDDYEELDFYISSKGTSIIKLIKKSTIYQSSDNKEELDYSLYDIKDWNENIYSTAIAAAPIPKIFLNSTKSSGLIVKNFSVDTDITISIVEDLIIEEPFVLAFSVNLENSLAESVTKEDVGFVGEFKPIGIKKYLDTTKQYALYFKENDNDKWSFKENVSYNENKGTLKPKEYYTNLGKYAFKALDRTNSIEGTVKNSTGENIEEFYILEDNGTINVFADGVFDFSHTDTKSFKVFADGYMTSEVEVDSSYDIVLEKITTTSIDINVNPIFGNSSLPDEIEIKIEHNLANIPKYYTMKKENNAYAIEEFAELLIGKTASIENNIDFIIENNSTIYLLPELNNISVSKESIDYSDMIEFGNYLLSVSSKGLIEYFNKDTLEKISYIDLGLAEIVFDSFIVVGDYFYIATFSGNIYKFDNEFTKTIVFTTDTNVFLPDPFIFKPITYNDEIYFPSKSGLTKRFDLNDSINGSYIFSNSPNYLFLLNEKIVSIANNGVIKYLDSSINEITTLNEGITLQKITKDNENIYIASDDGLYKINSEFSSTKVLEKEFLQISIVDKLIFAKNETKLEIYNLEDYSLKSSIDYESGYVKILSTDNYYVIFNKNNSLTILDKISLENKANISLDIDITNISEVLEKLFIKNKNGKILYFDLSK